MRKIILSVILITILVLSVFSIYLFADSATLGAHVVELKLDTGDTAWMLVARLRLIDDSWAWFLLRRNGRKEKRN